MSGRKDAELAAAGSIEGFAPTKDAEFETLGRMINEKLKAYEGTKGHMVTLKGLVRLAAANMSVDECKELSSFISVLYNDKARARELFTLQA